MDLIETTPGAEAADAAGPPAPTTAREEQGAAEAAPRVAWPLAIALSLALGVTFRLTDRGTLGNPYLPFYVWAAAAGAAILLYLWLGRAAVRGAGARRGEAETPRGRDVAWAAVVIAAFVIDALTLAPPRHPGLALLAALHLPALTWMIVGLAAIGPAGDPLERFAAVVKSVEVLVTGAVFAGAVVIFAAVTFSLFDALGLGLPPSLRRTLLPLLAAFVPVLAVATVYDPGLRPAAQRFGAPGFARLLFVAARVLLPPTLLVLLVVALVLPWRFAALAESRRTLIAFNAMLFAVMLLLVGATPVRADGLGPALRGWLRRGVVASAFLAALTGVYALAAVLARTGQGGLTPNRLTVIGWNVVNVATLSLLLVLQIRVGRARWERAVHVAMSAGLVLYFLWTAFVLVALPLVARAAHWPLEAHG